MFESFAHRPVTGGSRSARGQSLVEFALVLPMLLVLLLGVADFGRVFSAGITVEAAARNAAEAAAQEYLQLRRETTALTTSDYDRIHAVAIATVCEEASTLPNKAGSGSSCSMPASAVCIHDDSAELPGYATCGADGQGAPADCVIRDSAGASIGGVGQPLPWPSLWNGRLPSVEVRVCYRFTTLFNLQNLQLPFSNGLSIGDIWLQKDRVFTVADYGY